MAFGVYRLSIEEQQKSVAEASRQAHLQRIVEVRRQTQRFSSEQRQKYKASLAAAESLTQIQHEAAWLTEREQQLAALQRQYRRERHAFGRAQRDADQEVDREHRLQCTVHLEEKVRTDRRRQRFNTALRLLRQSAVAKRHLLTQCLERRRLEQQLCRTKAAEYGQTWITPKETSNSLPKTNGRGLEVSIDFRFSRLHQQLGIRTAAERVAADEGESAMKAAGREKRRYRDRISQSGRFPMAWCRVLAVEERMGRERRVMGDRARDRGEVALLRERAIVQRQLHEAELEKTQRAETKRKQKEGVTKRVPLVNKIQNGANCPMALESIRQAISQTHRNHSTSVPEICQTSETEGKGKNVVCLQDSCAEIGIQVNTEVDEQKLKAPRSVDQLIKAGSLEMESKSTTVPSCKEGRNTKRKNVKSSISERQSCLRNGTENKQKAERQNSMHSQQPDTTLMKENIVSDKTRLKRNPKQNRKNSTQLGAVHNPSDKSKPIKECPADSLAAEALNPSVRGKKNENSETTKDANLALESTTQPKVGEDYEDALSEALSMDTDLFMIEYFSNFTAPPSNESDSSDSIQLDKLSALLASSETDSQAWGERSSLQESDADLEDLSRDAPSPSVAKSISDPTSQFSMSTSTSRNESSITSESHCFSEASVNGCVAVELSDTHELLRGLDRISGESLTLLSSLSSLITSQTSSSDAVLESPSRSDVMSLEEGTRISQEEHSTSSYPPSSAMRNMSSSLTYTADSLLLDTIIEESDDTIISITNSSQSRDPLWKSEILDLSEDLSLMEDLDLSSVEDIELEE